MFQLIKQYVNIQGLEVKSGNWGGYFRDLRDFLSDEMLYLMLFIDDAPYLVIALFIFKT